MEKVPRPGRTAARNPPQIPRGQPRERDLTKKGGMDMGLPLPESSKEPPSRPESDPRVHWTTASLLTKAEHKLVDDLAKCVNLFAKTMDEIHGKGWRSATGFNNPGTGDANEFMQAIHVCQNMVLSRAAARAYPGRYRL